MLHTLSCRYFQRALLWSVPIGGLAGLVGLGGGEFRLPVLTQVLGFGARTAIPLNLLISLATLAAALVARGYAVPLPGIGALWPELVGLALGGTLAAAYGSRLVLRLQERRLAAAVAALLGGLGMLMLLEAMVPFGGSGLAGEAVMPRAAIGAGLGLLVGLVSSMLGVAGGELLIPALVFVFGADIRIAGSASLLVSLPIVGTGLWRYRRAGALGLPGGARRIAGAMVTGSLIGAGLGGLAMQTAPETALKLVLGLVLLVAAAKAVAKGDSPRPGERRTRR